MAETRCKTHNRELSCPAYLGTLGGIASLRVQHPASPVRDAPETCVGEHVRDKKGPRCKIHKVKLICPACVGAKGGGASGGAKAEASRANLKLAWKILRKYPRCPRYGSHRFSPYTGRCPCGFQRPEESR